MVVCIAGVPDGEPGVGVFSDDQEQEIVWFMHKQSLIGLHGRSRHLQILDRECRGGVKSVFLY